ncbi:MAG: magnesium/cobalt transporter CorA [Phycisphaerae bacterium]|nr:magnesium/cobalt transporter CorA [Phycisphaerae bacterium]
MGRKRSRKHHERPPVERHEIPDVPPGTLTVAPDACQPVLRIFAYSPVDCIEREVARPEEVRDFLGKWPVVWVNVDGLADVNVISVLGEIFGVHRLALEDVANVHERAKVEEYPKHLFLVLRAMHLDEKLTTEQVSIFLSQDFVLTFQERPGDCFDHVRDRIRQAKGRVREASADYLAYCLLDAVVDSNFPILEEYGNRLEEMEEAVIERPDSRAMVRIRQAKRDLLTFRRAVWPLRDVINVLLRDHSVFISPETRVYLRDCYDHVVQNIDMIETYRELGSGLMDVYMSSLSNRMNEIMKVLTIFAAIFIPLTFLAGVYGMNFDPDTSPWNMPELRWHYGYPGILLVMVLMAVAMLFFFRRKGWIGRGSGGRNVEG